MPVAQNNDLKCRKAVSAATDVRRMLPRHEIVPAFIGRIDLKLEGFVFYCKNGLHLLFSLSTVLYKSNIQKTEQLKMNKALHPYFQKKSKIPDYTANTTKRFAYLYNI